MKKSAVFLLFMFISVISYVCFSQKGELANEVSGKESDEEKVVYLTFDDGPSKNTEKILDILKKNDVRATFFLIGNQVNDNTSDVVKRMIKEGHQIGVHTYSHDAKKIYKDDKAYYNDILKAERVIIENTGVVPLVYRFPWGSNNCYVMKFRNKVIKRLKKIGLEFCDWNVSGEDSVGSPTVQSIIKNIKNGYNRYNEPVVLLHDSASNKATVEALPRIIKMYREAGYSFGTVSERSRIYQWRVTK